MRLRKCEKSFLKRLGDQNEPLDVLLREEQATLWNLSDWLKRPPFRDRLQDVLNSRTAVHELSQALIQFWAAEQFSQRLQLPGRKVRGKSQPATDKATMELLRRVGCTPAKAGRDDGEPQQKPPISFVHPDVPEDEQSELIRRLRSSEQLDDRARAA